MANCKCCGQSVPDTLATRLIQLRESKGINQADFADRVGISQPVLSCIESGQRLPRVTQIISFCDVLGCTPNDLMDWEVSA